VEEKTIIAANRLSDVCAGALRLILGLGPLGIAVGGLYICSDLVNVINPASVHAQPGMHGIASSLAWLVLFGPFVWVSYLILRSPKNPIGAIFSPRKPFSALSPLVDHEFRQPVADASDIPDVARLDDKTVMKLSARVDLTVKVFAVLGSLFVVGLGVVCLLSLKGADPHHKLKIISWAVMLSFLGIQFLKEALRPRGKGAGEAKEAGTWQLLKIFGRTVMMRSTAQKANPTPVASTQSRSTVKQLEGTNPRIISVNLDIDERK